MGFRSEYQNVAAASYARPSFGFAPLPPWVGVGGLGGAAGSGDRECLEAGSLRPFMKAGASGSPHPSPLPTRGRGAERLCHAGLMAQTSNLNRSFWEIRARRFCSPPPRGGRRRGETRGSTPVGSGVGGAAENKGFKPQSFSGPNNPMRRRMVSTMPSRLCSTSRAEKRQTVKP